MNISIIPLIGAITFFGLGLFIFIDYYRFNKNVVKSNGVISEYSEYQSKSSQGRNLTKYRPIFEFSSNGNHFKVKSKTSYNSQVIPIGQEVEVLFNKGEENKARLAKENGYGLGILFVMISLPAFYFGLFR